MISILWLKQKSNNYFIWLTSVKFVVLKQIKVIKYFLSAEKRSNTRLWALLPNPPVATAISRSDSPLPSLHISNMAAREGVFQEHHSAPVRPRARSRTCSSQVAMEIPSYPRNADGFCGPPSHMGHTHCPGVCVRVCVTCMVSVLAAVTLHSEVKGLKPSKTDRPPLQRASFSSWSLQSNKYSPNLHFCCRFLHQLNSGSLIQSRSCSTFKYFHVQQL